MVMFIYKITFFYFLDSFVYNHQFKRRVINVNITTNHRNVDTSMKLTKEFLLSIFTIGQLFLISINISL